MGAWIETWKNILTTALVVVSHPSWVRGLKPHNLTPLLTSMSSHPSWVRGLKRNIGDMNSQTKASHPSWVRGLKQIDYERLPDAAWSHPSWVRGLKHALQPRKQQEAAGRTPRGCVD